MRDPEGDDYVSQPLSRPATPATPNSDNLPVVLNSRNGLLGSTNGGNSMARSAQDLLLHQYPRETDVDNFVSQSLLSTVTSSTT